MISTLYLTDNKLVMSPKFTKENKTYKREKSPNQERKNITIGSKVKIVLKKDQGTDKRVEGTVKRLLTSKSLHSRGIKVELTDGSVGRVQEIIL